MSEKKEILIFTDWFVPAYKAGGPVRSVYNIVNKLGSKFSFYIVTSDRDLGCNKPLSNIVPDKLTIYDNYKIIYLSPQNQTLKTYTNILRENSFSKIYINGIFSYKFSILPLIASARLNLRNKVLIAPRGMLGNESLKIKFIKKRLFLITAKFINLYKNIKWHATNSEEKSNIFKHTGKNALIFEAPNIADSPPTFVKKDFDGTLKLVFVSRIVKIKNLSFALQILTKVKTEHSILFDIYGPVEDLKYYNYCKDIANQLPQNININFYPELQHSKVVSTLSDYHFLFLPTLHENFGHIIFESFSAGVPVIISKNTPWQNLSNKNLGFDINLNDIELFTETIQNICNLSKNIYDEMSYETYNFAQKFSSDSDIINKTVMMFDNE